MAGGIVSLIAIGAQDGYITGTPHITYFKSTYRRHTNFAMEVFVTPIVGAQPGSRSNVEILRHADLASKMCIRVKLPAIRSNVLADPKQKIAWTKRLGHVLIKRVGIKIGGMTIDEHLGIWLDILYELTHSKSSERGYLRMIGDVPELTALKGKELFHESVEEMLPEYTIYVPLQFWFCRDFGSAIPLTALQYHQIMLSLEFEDVSRLITWTGTSSPDISDIKFKECSLLVDHIYLDTEERAKVAHDSCEYLIEQVQHQDEAISGSTGSGSTIAKCRLSFNHPTKEIVWALQVGAFNGGNVYSQASGQRGRFLGYTHDNNKWHSDALDYAAKNIAESAVLLNPTEALIKSGEVNSIPVHEVKSKATGNDGNMGHRIKVEIVNTNVEAFTKASPPTEIDTTNNAGIKVYVADTWFSGLSPVFLRSKEDEELLDYIDSARVIVKHADGKIVSVEAVEVKHRLNLEQISVPLEDLQKDSRFVHNSNFKVHPDVFITQLNYGLRLDGGGNPVVSGTIELNATPRFERMNGSYFNYYQPYNHHTSTPCDGINVYSFAIRPEKHQPQGTTNLSRIDSTILNLEISDTVRSNRSTKLDYLRDSKLHIFAWSYNIVRISNGMAGLAYAN